MAAVAGRARNRCHLSRILSGRQEAHLAPALHLPSIIVLASEENAMITLGITVAALGYGMTAGTGGALLGPAFTPAEMLAGLGAAIVATLGVVVVRALNAPSRKPAAPAPSIHPRNDGVKNAA
jgi:hypothetical protein